jgi:steroid delta-isomerase-like uncharacterized protein
MAENADLVRSTIEAWNSRDFDYIAEHTASEGVLTDAGSGETWRGPDGSREYSKMWADAFPDGRITIDRIIEAGDLVVVQYTGQGTHTGPMVTRMGTIPATGRSATLRFCDVYEVKDGKVHKQDTYGDSGSLMAQLGLTGAPASTTQ